MDSYYNQNYTKEQITQILAKIKHCVKTHRFTISRNEHRQENIDFINIKALMEKLCAMCYNKYDTLLMNRRKGKGMKTSYNNLWKMLIDRNMQKKDLIDKLGISSTTIAKMGKGDKVSLDVLERICAYFDCNIGDVISFEKED